MAPSSPERMYGVESVWDYPRPAVARLVDREVVVLFGGEVIAEADAVVEVVEMSHPPNVYISRDDIRPGVLTAAHGTRWSEAIGEGHYLNAVVGQARAQRAAWYYPHPLPGYELLCDRVAFLPGSMDECWMDGEPVTPQPGGFYGGWITSRVRGPFKGERGTAGW